MKQTNIAKNQPQTIGQFSAFGVLLDIVQTERGGRPHLQCFSAECGSPFGTLSAHLPGVKLEPGELLIRTHSENEPLRPLLLATGYFTDTGKRIPSGFVDLEVWQRSESAPSTVKAKPATPAFATCAH